MSPIWGITFLPSETEQKSDLNREINRDEEESLTAGG